MIGQQSFAAGLLVLAMCFSQMAEANLCNTFSGRPNPEVRREIVQRMRSFLNQRAGRIFANETEQLGMVIHNSLTALKNEFDSTPANLRDPAMEGDSGAIRYANSILQSLVGREDVNVQYTKRILDEIDATLLNAMSEAIPAPAPKKQKSDLEALSETARLGSVSANALGEVSYTLEFGIGNAGGRGLKSAIEDLAFQQSVQVSVSEDIGWLRRNVVVRTRGNAGQMVEFVRVLETALIKEANK